MKKVNINDNGVCKANKNTNHLLKKTWKITENWKYGIQRILWKWLVSRIGEVTCLYYNYFSRELRNRKVKGKEAIIYRKKDKNVIDSLVYGEKSNFYDSFLKSIDFFNI